MSAVENTTAPVVTDAVPAVETTPVVAAPAVEGEAPKVETAEDTKTDAAPVAEEAKADEAAPVEEKAVEPITEGQLAYKGPGLVKSLIASKKEFWLSDDAVSAENLDLFLRGEKPETAHPVVAWASQTGKGLLFFNKKGDSDRTHPGSVLDLYNATDLKKESAHQFAFKLHGHAHTFKAGNDAERDGWYISVEKAIELGKASQEEVQGSEGYKAELEKLNKPQTPAVAAGAAKSRSQSQPKKSTELDKEANRANSEAEEDEAEKKKKSRSTSRGLFGRKKGKVEEAEQKPAEKEEKDESKPEGEAAVAATAAVATGPVIATEVAPTEDKPAEAATETTEPTEAKTEEAPKASKRGSIFGKLSGWGGVKSPVKEKEQKEAELTTETPATETPAVETAAVETKAPAEPETALPTAEEPSTEAVKEEVATPNKEKSKFLSGFGFTKRGRSVSPSNALNTAEETTVVPEVAPAAEPSAEKVEEPTVEAPATESAEKPTEEVKTDAAAKRQSILGSLGRRASKAFKGIQTPKQETAAPATAEATKEETATESAPVEVGEETKALEAEVAQNQIGDVVPEAVSIGQPEHSAPVVTASA